MTTLYWEAHEGDGFRESGFSKERRLEPQITVGLLTTRSGFPLRVDGFEGDRAETKTILPVLEGFAREHDAKGITVVADAGMMSERNVVALLGAGFHTSDLSFGVHPSRALHMRLVVPSWRQDRSSVSSDSKGVDRPSSAL